MNVARPVRGTMFQRVSMFFIAFLLVVFPEQGSAHAQRRAARTVQFQAGQALLLGPTGKGAAILAQQSRGRAMVLAGFDEDRVADLAIGYGLSKGGAIALMRGSLDALTPQSHGSWLAAGQGRYASLILPDVAIAGGGKLLVPRGNNSALSTGLAASFSLTNPPGPAMSFVVDAPLAATVGRAFDVFLTAYDGFGNVATGYTGTVHFTSSDASAILPADSTLTNGAGTFSATFQTAGIQTITATDTATISITGTSGSIPVSIPSFVVTNIDDSGTGSLRAALANAASAGSGNITFDPTVFATAQIIALTNGTLNIPSNTAIQGYTTGSGALLTNSVTIAGGGSSSNFSVFEVDSGVTAAAISNLNITDGYINSDGGGVDNNGVLTITECTFSNNYAAGTLGSGNGGGAIHNAGTLTVVGSTFSNNTSAPGGAMEVDGGAVTISDSTFYGNSAINGTAGGVMFINGNGPLALVAISNSTLSGNSAQSGGGIYNYGTLTVTNSILAGNAGGDCGASGVSSCPTNGGDGNLVGGMVSLAPLGNYGGPTQTMIPLPGSPAICFISPSTATGTDQRGDPRTTTYNATTCQDSGAAQTNYALTFSTDPPASVLAGTSFGAGVTLDESGIPFVATATPLPIIAIPLTLNGSGTLTGGTAIVNDATGVTTYSGLQVSQAGSDTLTASLTLNPNTTPTALSISATSSTVDVELASTTTAASNAAATYSAAAQNVTLTATITSTSGTVNAGSVTFALFQGATPIGAAVIGTVSNGLANASYTLPAGTSGGTYTIEATYSGGASFAGSSDGTHTLTINAGGTTTAASNATATYSTAAQQVTLTATVTSTAGTVSSGTVTFTLLNGLAHVGTAVTSGTVTNGTASASYTLPAGTAAGPYAIEAVYGGAASLLTSIDTTHTLTVTKAATTILATNTTATFSISAQSVSLTATVASPSGPVNAGTVTFTVLQRGTPVGTAVTNRTVANGVASATYPLPASTAIGTYAIQATYSGATSLLTSTENLATLIVGKATATVTLSNLTQTYTGSPLSATATTLPAGLSVNFTYNGRTTTPTTAGNYLVIGTISSSNYQGLATGTLKITQATPPITWATPAPITYGTALSATQLDASSTVAGTFAYTPAAGTVLTTGPQTLSAIFTPTDTTDYTAATASVTLTVNEEPQTISFSAGTVADASGVTLGATPLTLGATSTSGLPVVFSLISGPAALNGNTLTINGAGTAVIAANQAGNSNYAPAPQVTESIPVNKALPVAAIASSVNPVLLQNGITFTANVTSGAGTPTGTVTFVDGTTALGTATLSGGVATSAAASLAVGPHTITAAYGGDANFLTASSSPLTQLVEDFGFTVSTQTETVLPGGTAVFTFTVSPINGSTFPAAITLSASGLPAGATFAFSPATIAAGQGSAAVTLTIDLPQTQAGINPAELHPKIERALNGAGGKTGPHGGTPGVAASHLAPLALALILLPFAGRLRRGGKRLSRTLSVLLLLVAGTAAAAGISGCGSSSGFFEQQQQNYSVIVTGTSGALSHSATVTLTVE